MREPREGRLIKGMITCDRLGQVDVVIRNISSHGVGGTTKALFEAGEAVLVQMAGVLPISGHVAWCRNGRFGVALEEAIDPSATLQKNKAAAADSQVADRFRPVPPELFKRPGVKS